MNIKQQTTIVYIKYSTDQCGNNFVVWNNIVSVRQQHHILSSLPASSSSLLSFLAGCSKRSVYRSCLPTHGRLLGHWPDFIDRKSVATTANVRLTFCGLRRSFALFASLRVLPSMPRGASSVREAFTRRTLRITLFFRLGRKKWNSTIHMWRQNQVSGVHKAHEPMALTLGKLAATRCCLSCSSLWPSARRERAADYGSFEQMQRQRRRR